jgi:protein-S-isoprenylcysteine O-methyltransferase Ste14
MKDDYPLSPNHAAHDRWWQTFEAVFGIPFLAAIVLHLLLPLSFPRGIPLLALMLLGVVLIIAGIALVIQARRAFAQHGQPTDPGRPTSQIITTGLFSITRNPLYLGGVCVLLGIALALNLPWVFIFLLPSVIACHIILIAPEERYLAARFGEEYRRYAAQVHRWLGRKRRPG